MALNRDGKMKMIVTEDLWNGLNEGFHETAAEYSAEKGVTYERPELTPGEPEQEVQEEKVKVPLYLQSASYARDHGELEQYQRSRNANMACKSAIEQAIFDNFDGMHLKTGAVKPVMEQFGRERTAYILANTIQHKSWDKRFSYNNKLWSKTVPVMEDSMDAFGNDRTAEWVVDKHSAVLDGFVSMFCREVWGQRWEKELTADEITSFEEIGRHYYPHLRIAEYVFTCDVRGERNLLTYEVSQHDNGESYSLHTEKDDIWDRMSRKELDKLETIVDCEVTFAGWKKEIEHAETTSDLREVDYGMMETEYLNLSDEQRERLYQMIEEKEKSFPDSQRDGQSAEQSEATTPPTASQGEKVKRPEPGVRNDDATVPVSSGDRKESVLQALRERQAKLKAEEPEKSKQETQNRKKEGQEL